MTVVIAGAHGQIARQLGELLADEGNEVLGLIRNPDHGEDLAAVGVTPVVMDLEQDEPRLAEMVEGAAAAVFAAGAGPGSGEDRKWTMDRDGAIRLITACQKGGVPRYVMVSAMGARTVLEDEEGGGGTFGAYLRAKAEADRALEQSGLAYTIIRPGSLTDDPPQETVALAPELPRGSIPRADVARTLLAVLDAPNTINRALDLTSGPMPIAEAVAAV